MTTAKVYLSRRNLLTLLSKLDRKANGEETMCTLYKQDAVHKKYPQSHPFIQVTAVEDEEYYTDREAGNVHPKDEPKGVWPSDDPKNY